MTRKTDQQLKDYGSAAVAGQDGVTMDKQPEDQDNEHAFETAAGMTGSEAAAFENAVQDDVEVGSPVIGGAVRAAQEASEPITSDAEDLDEGKDTSLSEIC